MTETNDFPTTYKVEVKCLIKGVFHPENTFYSAHNKEMMPGKETLPFLKLISAEPKIIKDPETERKRQELKDAGAIKTGNHSASTINRLYAEYQSHLGEKSLSEG